MTWILTPQNIHQTEKEMVGGKGFALASLVRGGFAIPTAFCVTSQAYRDYVARTGLRERILLELNRKDFKEMRWEEIWDCATRIRNLFLRKPMPSDMSAEIKTAILSIFKDKAVVVRSSAPEEDTAAASFAGLHESFVNVRGENAILEHIRKVWASLWSDAALLYRQEIGLDVTKSNMAVVVQEIVIGDRSGVAFSKNPNNTSQAVIESVYGLNQGLVDGTIEPDRWIIDRQQQTLISHTPARRKQWMTPSESGVTLTDLPKKYQNHPPLNTGETRLVFSLAMDAENHFKTPQDVEWTYRRDDLFVLQSRPITTLPSKDGEDNRGWYLSLHRSFENLKLLRKKIEHELIPGMIAAADQMAQTDLSQLTDRKLAKEIQHRWEINQQWSAIYWEDFIPFAHGIRLFGQFYNDTLHPNDPYEFVNLLTRTEMASLERNQLMSDLAGMVRDNQSLAASLKKGTYDGLDTSFQKAVAQFFDQYGDLFYSVDSGTQYDQTPGSFYQILLEMAENLPAKTNPQHSNNRSKLLDQFISCFEGERRKQAEEMLDLARSSYQIRDDDNIYLGRIEAQWLASLREAKHRIKGQPHHKRKKKIAVELIEVVDNLDHSTRDPIPLPAKSGEAFKVQARQLIGQPAGPGLAKGPARVIQQTADLSSFKHGEILICDAVDPNMTFVVPLAAGIIERRGGMLIHGAIIAREYGLPCVTGVPDVTAQIKNGDEVTVDGYLGIITIGSSKI